METSNSEPKKTEQFYRIFFKKRRSTKKYLRGKVIYKDISAYSYDEAINKAEDYIRNDRKGKELILLSEEKI